MLYAAFELIVFNFGTLSLKPLRDGMGRVNSAGTAAFDLDHGRQTQIHSGAEMSNLGSLGPTSTFIEKILYSSRYNTEPFHMDPKKPQNMEQAELNTIQ